MVKALHKAGIEVILDVVFNHTDEGNHQGPTISFKGLDNDAYYYLHRRPTGSTTWTTPAAATRSTATTRSCEKLIVDCLRVLGRARCTSTASASTRARSSPAATDGAPMATRRCLADRAVRGRCADTKIIAEAWDAAGLYQVGYFPGLPLGRVERPLPRRRPALRARATPGMVGAVADAHLPAASDLYQAQRPPADQQHQLHHLPRRLHAQRPRLLQREAQRGQRRGQPRRQRRQPELELRRRGPDRRSRPSRRSATRQVKNFAALLMLSQGVPMFVAGDEVRRTQQRQQQRLLPGQRDLAGSTGRWSTRTPTCSGSSADDRLPQAPRRAVHRRAFFTGDANERGVRGHRAGTAPSSTQPGWDDPDARVLAFTLGRLRATTRTCT